MKSRLWNVLNFAICSFLVLSVFSCASASADKKEVIRKPIPVKIIKVADTLLPLGNYYVGKLVEHLASSLSFSVTGQVIKVYKREGDIVKKGDKIARIDDAILKDLHQATLASLNQVQDAYNRMKQLYNAGTLPEVKWVEINSKLKQAQSAERIAKTKLSDAILYAPYDGFISYRSCEIGENVMPLMTKFKIVNLDQLAVKISVPELEIINLESNDVYIRIEANPNQLYKGKIDLKGIVGNPITHTYGVNIVLDNPKHKVLPGMLAKVFVKELTKEIIIVPSNAVQIFYTGDRFVWTVEDGKAVRKFIKVNRVYEGGVEVIEGLSNGDEVIVAGFHKVGENERVEVLF